jgi:hypothetical protein
MQQDDQQVNIPGIPGLGSVACMSGLPRPTGAVGSPEPLQWLGQGLGNPLGKNPSES